MQMPIAMSSPAEQVSSPVDYVTSTGSSESPGSDVKTTTTSGQRRSKTRKSSPRSTFSREELHTFESYFAENPLPNSETVTALAKHLRLPREVVRVWFQNRRAKARKQSKGLLPAGRCPKVSRSDGGDASTPKVERRSEDTREPPPLTSPGLCNEDESRPSNAWSKSDDSEDDQTVPQCPVPPLINHRDIHVPPTLPKPSAVISPSLHSPSLFQPIKPFSPGDRSPSSSSSVFTVSSQDSPRRWDSSSSVFARPSPRLQSPRGADVRHFESSMPTIVYVPVVCSSPDCLPLACMPRPSELSRRPEGRSGFEHVRSPSETSRHSWYYVDQQSRGSSRSASPEEDSAQSSVFCGTTPLYSKPSPRPTSLSYSTRRTPSPVHLQKPARRSSHRDERRRSSSSRMRTSPVVLSPTRRPTPLISTPCTYLPTPSSHLPTYSVPSSHLGSYCLVSY